MSEQLAPIEKAIGNLGWRNRVRYGERRLQIACLIRESDWRPIKAEWWQGKEACIIGADLDGNFFLRHCDGSVRLWDHNSRMDSVLAPSVRDFVSRIEE
jgi:hypothetical protein